MTVKTYDELKTELNDIKCQNCGGTGKCNDADFGDISFNEWTCPACGGSGIIHTVTAEIPL